MKFLAISGLALVVSSAVGCISATEGEREGSDDATQSQAAEPVAPEARAAEPVDADARAAGAAGSNARAGELCGGFAGIQCNKGLYCAYSAASNCGSGDQSGTCAAKPQACIQIYDPVCGCDRKTYGNACTAAQAGVSVASKGECEPPAAQAGESCGGHTAGPPPVCGAGLYCNYELSDTCGWADAPGTCAEKPTACTKIYRPVCGCDGKTYGNECEAAASGAAVLHPDVCE